MATGTLGTTAREYVSQQVHYLRFTLNYDDAADTPIGTLPAGALILKSQSSANVIVAFNAATTNTIDVGTAADDNLYATALAGGTIAQVPFDEFTASNLLAVDTVLTASYNQSGTAATAGSAEVIVAYIPDNDQ